MVIFFLAALPACAATLDRQAIIIDSDGEAVRRSVRVEKRWKSWAAQPDVRRYPRATRANVEPLRARGRADAAVASDKYEQIARKLANPAGCTQPATNKTLDEIGGVYPVEEFKDMLAKRTGTLWVKYTNSKDIALSNQLAVPWCPQPLPHDGSSDGRDGALAYIEKSLKGIDVTTPLILAVAGLKSTKKEIKRDYHLIQTMNFICGFQRLGLEKQVVLFTMDTMSAAFFRKLYPWLRVLYHDGLVEMINAAANRTNVRYGNRIAKLALSEWLISLDREVVLSDVDVHWIEDPFPRLQSLRTPDGGLVDMAAMKDTCWLELNSGFIYYRPTDRTKALLRMALSMRKFEVQHPSLPLGQTAVLLADNDQYLLNCAFARSAIEGLNYVILPRGEFHFGQLNARCRDGTPPEVTKAPAIWHTAGFTTLYEKEMDRVGALGLLDVSASSGACVDGRRGSAADVQRISSAVPRLCDFKRPDGIMLPGCEGNCSKDVEPTLARAMLADVSQLALE